MKTYKTTIHIPMLKEDWVREFESINMRELLVEIQREMNMFGIEQFEINTITLTTGLYVGFVYEDITLN